MGTLERLGIADPGSAASVALQDYVSDRSVALLLRPRPDQLEIGSGTCVRIGGHYFVATAGHNLSGLTARHVEVVPRGARQEPALGIVDCGISSKSPDVGWLLLDTAAVEASTLKAIGVGEISRVAVDGAQGTAVLVQGYPSDRVELLGGVAARPSVESVGLMTLVVPSRERSSGGSAVDFALEYPPWDGSLDAEGLPPPPGVSGGGVWLVPSFAEDKVWTLEQARLVGIAVSWRRRDCELNAVHIEYWIKCVRGAYLING